MSKLARVGSAPDLRKIYPSDAPVASSEERGPKEGIKKFIGVLDTFGLAKKGPYQDVDLAKKSISETVTKGLTNNINAIDRILANDGLDAKTSENLRQLKDRLGQHKKTMESSSNDPKAFSEALFKLGHDLNGQPIEQQLQKMLESNDPSQINKLADHMVGSLGKNLAGEIDKVGSFKELLKKIGNGEAGKFIMEIANGSVAMMNSFAFASFQKASMKMSFDTLMGVINMSLQMNKDVAGIGAK